MEFLYDVTAKVTKVQDQEYLLMVEGKYHTHDEKVAIFIRADDKEFVATYGLFPDAKEQLFGGAVKLDSDNIKKVTVKALTCNPTKCHTLKVKVEK